MAAVGPPSDRLPSCCCWLMLVVLIDVPLLSRFSHYCALGRRALHTHRRPLHARAQARSRTGEGLDEDLHGCPSLAENSNNQRSNVTPLCAHNVPTPTIQIHGSGYSRENGWVCATPYFTQNRSDRTCSSILTSCEEVNHFDWLHSLIATLYFFISVLSS